MKYSIIVPVYNVEKYVIKCLDSLKNQTIENKKYEVIIVNDGSTDNCEKIIKDYIKNLSNFKLFTKKNGGLSSARNYGIKKASGKYLLFVDSDDYIDINSLKILENNLENNLDILVFNMNDVTNEKITKTISFDKTISDKVKRYIISLPSACNKLIKKDLFKNINFLEGVYYEDLATIPKLGLLTSNIKFIDESLYYYVRRDNSIMNKPVYNKKMDSIFTVLEGLKAFFKEQNKEEIEYLYINHLLRLASLRYIDIKNCNEQLLKIVKIIKKEYPKWYKNKYYKNWTIKKRILCLLIYKKRYNLLSILRRKNEKNI